MEQVTTRSTISAPLEVRIEQNIDEDVVDVGGEDRRVIVGWKLPMRFAVDVYQDGTVTTIKGELVPGSVIREVRPATAKERASAEVIG